MKNLQKFRCITIFQDSNFSNFTFNHLYFTLLCFIYERITLQLKKNFEIIRVFKIDSWNLEILETNLNNVLLKEFKFEIYSTSSICDPQPDSDREFDLSYEFFEQNEDITITITYSLDQPPSDESWGLRDFSIEILIPCVSLHSECNYQGELFKICIGDNTILQKDLPFPIKSIKMASGTLTLHDPFYHSGESQIYTQSQPCLDDYKFPKVIYEQ